VYLQQDYFFELVNMYEINRTLLTDYVKEWAPMEENPEDWRDYGGVRYIFKTEIYKPGTATPLQEMKHTFEWPVAYAPVIRAAVISTPEIGTCDD